MNSKLSYSKRITDVWKVEYIQKKHGGETSIYAGGGFVGFRLKGKDVAVLHNALHECEAARKELEGVAERMGAREEVPDAGLIPLTPAMIADIKELPILADGATLAHHVETNQSWIVCGHHVSVFMFEVMQRYGLIVEEEPEEPGTFVVAQGIDAYKISDAGRAALARQEE